jgi:hypothetical protein
MAAHGMTVLDSFAFQFDLDGIPSTRAYAGFQAGQGTAADVDHSAEWLSIGPHRYWRLSKTDSAQSGGWQSQIQFGQAGPLWDASHWSSSGVTVASYANFNNGDGAPGTRTTLLPVRTSCWTRAMATGGAANTRDPCHPCYAWCLLY